MQLTSRVDVRLPQTCPDKPTRTQAIPPQAATATAYATTDDDCTHTQHRHEHHKRASDKRPAKTTTNEYYCMTNTHTSSTHTRWTNERTEPEETHGDRWMERRRRNRKLKLGNTTLFLCLYYYYYSVPAWCRLPRDIYVYVRVCVTVYVCRSLLLLVVCLYLAYVGPRRY